MPGGKSDRYGASLRHSEEWKSIKSCRVDDRFKVTHPRIERYVFNVPIREPIAACIVAKQREVPRKGHVEMAHEWAFPIVFDMIHPVCCFHQRWSAAHGRISEPYTIGCTAVVDLQLHTVWVNETFTIEIDRVSLDGFWNVLQFLRPERSINERQLALDLFVGLGGNTNTAGFGETFEARCNVHAIAVDIVVIDDDVTNIDADSKFNPVTLRDVGVTFCHGALNINSTTYGIHCAREFNQGAIAGILNDMAMVL